MNSFSSDQLFLLFTVHFGISAFTLFIVLLRRAPVPKILTFDSIQKLYHSKLTEILNDNTAAAEERMKKAQKLMEAWENFSKLM